MCIDKSRPSYETHPLIASSIMIVRITNITACFFFMTCKFFDICKSSEGDMRCTYRGETEECIGAVCSNTPAKRGSPVEVNARTVNGNRLPIRDFDSRLPAISFAFLFGCPLWCGCRCWSWFAEAMHDVTLRSSDRVRGSCCLSGVGRFWTCGA